MPRGVKKEITYTGKALKIYEKMQKQEAELKETKAALKEAYKEQCKEEKKTAARQAKEKKAALVKALEATTKSPEEILEFLSAEQ